MNESIEISVPTAEEKPKKAGGKKKTTNTRTAQKAKRKSFSNWEGHTLTPQEALFIDRYIETGNGRQSALEAYPNVKPSTAAQKAQQLLNKAYITSEINHRLEKARDESIATAEEVMQYFTSVMRGEIKDQFGLEASLGERTKAAQELAKRTIDIPNRLNGTEPPELKITLDWARPETETIGETVEGEMSNAENGSETTIGE